MKPTQENFSPQDEGAISLSLEKGEDLSLNGPDAREENMAELVRPDESLTEYFARISEYVPPIRLHIHLSPHGTRDDIAGARTHIEDSDIYFPEGINWTEESRAEKQELADRIDREDEHGVSGTQQMSPAAGTGVVIGNMDISKADSPRLPWMKDLAFGLRADAQGNFPDALLSYRAQVERFTHAQKEREAYMRAHLGPELARIVRARPELRERPEISVSVTLGSFHTGFGHDLVRVGEKVTRDFSPQPHRYPIASALERSFRFDVPPSDELLVGAYGEQLLSGLLGKEFSSFTTHSMDVLSFFRSVAEHLSRADVEALHGLLLQFEDERKSVRSEEFSKIKKTYSGREQSDAIGAASQRINDDVRGRAVVAVRSFLSERGISVPESKDEFDAWLENEKRKDRSEEEK